MRLPLVLLCFATTAQARELRHGDTIISWSPERLSIVPFVIGGKEKVIFQHREEKNEQGIFSAPRAYPFGLSNCPKRLEPGALLPAPRRPQEGRQQLRHQALWKVG